MFFGLACGEVVEQRHVPAFGADRAIAYGGACRFGEEDCEEGEPAGGEDDEEPEEGAPAKELREDPADDWPDRWT